MQQFPAAKPGVARPRIAPSSSRSPLAWSRRATDFPGPSRFRAADACLPKNVPNMRACASRARGSHHQSNRQEGITAYKAAIMNRQVNHEQRNHEVHPIHARSA